LINHLKTKQNMKKLMMLLLVCVSLTAFGQVKAAAIEDDLPIVEQSTSTQVDNIKEMNYQGDYVIVADDDWYEPIVVTYEDVSLNKRRKERYKFIAAIKYMSVAYKNTV